MVEAGEGVTARPLEKLGWHASDTAEIAFEDVAVPDDALLGEEGRGFYLIVANFQWERLLMSLGAVGSMRATLERMIAILARARLLPGVRHRVAALATPAEAGAALTYHGAAPLPRRRRRRARGDDGQAPHPARELRAPGRVLRRCSPTSATRSRTTSRAPPATPASARSAAGRDEIMKEILGKTMGL